jgi:hypothetical protein
MTASVGRSMTARSAIWGGPSRKRCHFGKPLVFSGHGCAYSLMYATKRKYAHRVTATALLQEGYVFDDFGSN